MTNTPKPQANTLDEIRGKLHLLYNGMTSNSKDADLILKTPVSDIVLQVEEQIQALITEARDKAVQEFCEDIAKKVRFEFEVGGHPGSLILPWEQIVRPIIYSKAKENK